MDILLAEIDEVLLAEAGLAAMRYVSGWKRDGHVGVVAGHDWLAAEVAVLDDGFELVVADTIGLPTRFPVPTVQGREYSSFAATSV